MPHLHIYKASAGSGKTYRLVQNYLAYVLEEGHRFEEVLAITFTNKAAAEMKERILSKLAELSQENGNEAYLKELQAIYRQEQRPVPDTETLRNRAGEVLSDILHNYSRFSVGTIDSFFQNILRSFARELNISVNYNLELDRESVLQEVADRLLDLAGTEGSEKVTRWLLDFMRSRLEQSLSWDVERELLSFSHRLFDDEFRALMDSLEENEAPSDALMRKIDDLIKELNKIIYSFENQMDKYGKEGLALMEEFGVAYDDFSGGKSSPMNYFNKIRKGNQQGKKRFVPGTKLSKCLNGEQSFISKNSPKKDELKRALDGGVERVLQQAVDHAEEHLKMYGSALLVKKHLFQLGILGHMNRILSDIRKERNLLLMDDTERLLESITTESDTPFIFEKTGTRYRFFLIDEFQDTSDRQWRNLLPLLENALQQEGDRVMIVGDEKQSIYRWRGGNMELLGSEAEKQLGRFVPNDRLQIVRIRENYRSARAIVRFNNALFSALPRVEYDSFKEINGFADHLENVIQEETREITGLVDWQWLEYDRKSDDEDSWRLKHLSKTDSILDEIQSDGYTYRDIAFLTETNEEGRMIADYLGRNGVPVISQDSLILSSAPGVRLLLSALNYLSNPDNESFATSLFYQYFTIKKQGKLSEPAFLALIKDPDKWVNEGFPGEFISGRNRLAHLPLYDLIIELIRIFALHHQADAFVMQFSDLVLNFAHDKSQSLFDFLEWWETVAQKEALSSSEGRNAVNVMTIHKAKGLQFPVLILPFFEFAFKHRVNPLIWVQSRNFKPFNTLPFLPVIYEDPKGQTLFDDTLKEEKRQMIADQINKWYVAFTRAEERLYVLAHEKTKSAAELSRKLMPNIADDLKNEFPVETNENGSRYRIGEGGKRSVTETVPPEKANSLPVDSYPLHPYQKRLGIRLHAARPGEEMAQGIRESLKYGRTVHELLARIESEAEIEEKADELVREGWLPESEKESLIEKIRSLFKKEEVRAWFDPAARIMAERELLLPDGTLLRPDRVIIGEKGAIVVDFKTGKMRPEDKKQVKEYARVLKEMGYEIAGIYLFYTQTGEIQNIA